MIQPFLIRGLVRLFRNGSLGFAEMAHVVWKFKLLSSLTDILWPENNTLLALIRVPIRLLIFGHFSHRIAVIRELFLLNNTT